MKMGGQLHSSSTLRFELEARVEESVSSSSNYSLSVVDVACWFRSVCHAVKEDRWDSIS
jgi:hypothetical protein